MDDGFRITGWEWVKLICDLTAMVMGSLVFISKGSLPFLAMAAFAGIAFAAKLVELGGRRRER